MLLLVEGGGHVAVMYPSMLKLRRGAHSSVAPCRWKHPGPSLQTPRQWQDIQSASPGDELPDGNASHDPCCEAQDAAGTTKREGICFQEHCRLDWVLLK